MSGVSVVAIPFTTWATVIAMLFLLVCVCYRRNRMITSIFLCVIVVLAFLPQLLPSTLTVQVQEATQIERDISEAKILQDGALASFKDKNYYAKPELSDDLDVGFYSEVSVKEDKKLFSLHTGTETKLYVIQMNKVYKDVYIAEVEDREELRGNAEEEKQ